MLYLNTDIPELKGFDTGICLSNLEVLDQRQDSLSESLLAVISELADAIIRDAGEDPDTIDSILLSLQASPEGDSPSETHPALLRLSPVNREAIATLSSRSGLQVRLLLYAMMEERMPSQPMRPLASPLPASVRGRIAYMPAAFADKAYLRLSAHVDNPRAAATATFVDACEEVHGGLCEYCILPLENSHSGKLTAFTRLILRYGLQIVGICDLENGAAEGQITRFALLRAASGNIPSPLALPPEGEPLYLEFVHMDESPGLSDLLIAAEFCGMRLCRVDTLPLPDHTEGDRDTPLPLDCVFNVADGNPAVFQRFLALEASEGIFLGLYSAI